MPKSPRVSWGGWRCRGEMGKLFPGEGGRRGVGASTWAPIAATARGRDLGMRLDCKYWATLAALLLLSLATAATAEPWPAWLPQYDVQMDLDLANHRVHVQLRATWTNPQSVATRELQF